MFDVHRQKGPLVVFRGLDEDERRVRQKSQPLAWGLVEMWMCQSAQLGL